MARSEVIAGKCWHIDESSVVCIYMRHMKLLKVDEFVKLLWTVILSMLQRLLSKTVWHLEIVGRQYFLELLNLLEIWCVDAIIIKPSIGVDVTSIHIVGGWHFDLILTGELNS